MSKIVEMPKRHIQAKCSSKHCSGCYHCELAVCEVCNCVEGSLTTHCLGEKIDLDTQERIYKQGHDFYNNRWIINRYKHPMERNPLFK